MRELKFRAWDTIQKGSCYQLRSVTVEELGKRENEIVMQYTGLLDKNGKEIYEGDIVRWSDGDWQGPSNPRIAEVRFDPELCFYAFNVDGGHKFGFSDFIYTDTEKHFEVIGNIYENPELMVPLPFA